MNLFDLDFLQLENYIVSLGEPKFRAKQVWEWLYKPVLTVDEMTNISKSLREKLREVFYLPKVGLKLVSKTDGTVKYLFEMKDGEAIESVVMSYKYGLTICVSCQAGCRMGCKFCASTQNGLSRNLTSGEIMGQILVAQRDMGERISHIVMMGSGEPFDNFDNVAAFLKTATDSTALGISARHITVSTCGLLTGVDKLIGLSLPVNLSFSLHSPFDHLRKKLMPISNSYSVNEVVEAARKYYRLTGRRVTFEYALIAGENDSKECAEELTRILSGKDDFHINLIPVNSIDESGFKKSSKSSIDNFINILEKHNIKATIRREMGADISAACGQLRNKGLKPDGR